MSDGLVAIIFMQAGFHIFSIPVTLHQYMSFIITWINGFLFFLVLSFRSHPNDGIFGHRRSGRIQGIRAQTPKEQSNTDSQAAQRPTKQNPSPTKRQRESGIMVGLLHKVFLMVLGNEINHS